MNLIDLFVLAVALFFGVRGYRRGLVQESMEGIAVVVGLVVAYRVHASLAMGTTLILGIPESVTRPVLFAAIAIAVTAIGFAVATLLSRAIASATWKATDRWGGFTFGMLKGLALCALILVFAGQTRFTSALIALEQSASGRATFALMPEVYRHVYQWMERIE